MNNTPMIIAAFILGAGVQAAHAGEEATQIKPTILSELISRERDGQIVSGWFNVTQLYLV
ncbi:MAG: hypothetical protein LBF65_02950 [Holosporales bacterium]|jgi:hypothetical protein|nr:hypothetical protein [Holosporales bacterium]